MITVNYTKTGVAVADHMSERVAKSFSMNETFHVSTENVILAVRALVSEGVYKSEDIKIQQDGVDCEWVGKGNLKGFKGTAYDDYLDRMLKL